MPLLIWNETYSVNVAEIDRQHQKLVDIINELFDAMKIGQANTVIEKLLNELHDYTKKHFSYEETYMKKFGFSDLERQEQQHQLFIDKVNDFITQYKANRLSLSLDMMGFLKDWLVNHIVKLDKQYSSLFNENGMK